ncbi:hypothetical protein AB0H76_02790 [Nocardia sp. NPDC050712]|uniref:hypothetical protein n=1 Tax=Nocardia sp. NPDC050712 TaxID=3155518 RepID=UPI0033F7CB76
MSSKVGPRAAGSRSAVAQVRGAAAGSISGAISLAAHGWASGGMTPGGTTLVLLAAASAIVGALVAGIAPLRDTSGGLIAALVAGQLLGHTTMGISSGHLHHGDAQLTPAMLTAHIVAAFLAALVIRGAEAAYRIGTAVLARMLPALYRALAIPGPAPLRTIYRDCAILRVLAAGTLRTRGPPLVARV